MNRIARELGVFVEVVGVLIVVGVATLNVFAYVGVGGGYVMLKTARARATLGTMITEPAWAQDSPPTVMVPVPRVGSKWTVNGTTYTVENTNGMRVLTPAPGFKVCPSGHPVTTNANEQDTREATVCRDGSGPYGPNCAAGSMTYLCNPTTGMRQELVTPSQAQYATARTNNQPAPQPWLTAQHR